jgi:hypothetical protein
MWTNQGDLLSDWFLAQSSIILHQRNADANAGDYIDIKIH